MNIPNSIPQTSKYLSIDNKIKRGKSFDGNIETDFTDDQKRYSMIQRVLESATSSNS